MKIFGTIGIGGLPGDLPPGDLYDGLLLGLDAAAPDGLLPIPPNEGKLKLGILKNGSLGSPIPPDPLFGAPYVEDVPEGCRPGLKKFAIASKNKGAGDARTQF